MQLEYTKYCCFLCMWDSRDRSSHYIKKDCPARNLNTDEKNVIADPLVDPKDVLLPPLHIKLGLMKIFVKGMNLRPYKLIDTPRVKYFEANIF